MKNPDIDTTELTKDELINSLFKDARKINNPEIEDFYIKYNIEFLIDYFKKNNKMSIEDLLHINIFKHSESRGHLQYASSFFKKIDNNEIISANEIRDIVIYRLKNILTKNKASVILYLNLDRQSLTFLFKHKRIMLILDLKTPNKGTFFRKKDLYIKEILNKKRSNVIIPNFAIIKIIDWLNHHWFYTNRILYKINSVFFIN